MYMNPTMGESRGIWANPDVRETLMAESRNKPVSDCVNEPWKAEERRGPHRGGARTPIDIGGMKQTAMKKRKNRVWHSFFGINMGE